MSRSLLDTIQFQLRNQRSYSDNGNCLQLRFDTPQKKALGTEIVKTLFEMYEFHTPSWNGNDIAPIAAERNSVRFHIPENLNMASIDETIDNLRDGWRHQMSVMEQHTSPVVSMSTDKGSAIYMHKVISLLAEYHNGDPKKVKLTHRKTDGDDRMSIIVDKTLFEKIARVEQRCDVPPFRGRI